MHNDIYTPAAVAEAIISGGRGNDVKPSTATVIQIGDFQISISMIAATFTSSMSEVDIRIYDLSKPSPNDQGTDETQQFAKEMGCISDEYSYHFFKTSDDLFDIMVHARNKMSHKERATKAKG